MRALLPIALAVTLGGCGLVPKPAPQTVLVPCEAPKVDRPSFPFDTLPAEADIFTKVKTLLADRETRKGYEGKLEAATEACRK
jgi:hypothetical protein